MQTDSAPLKINIPRPFHIDLHKLVCGMGFDLSFVLAGCSAVQIQVKRHSANSFFLKEHKEIHIISVIIKEDIHERVLFHLLLQTAQVSNLHNLHHPVVQKILRNHDLLL